TPLYPLKFHPQLKEKVWGGDKLRSVLGKTDSNNMGESWEISGVAGNISVVSNGELIGKNLSQLIHQFKGDLMGERVYKQYDTEFPLLFKFIDAKEDLSVQLHPNDEIAKQRHNSFGKTEMWYVMDADEDARLILGFNESLDETEYKKLLSENNLVSKLHAEKVKEGDAFFIAPGTVHAIGGGIMLAEIQQTSDITYRIYDWDRPGLDGKMRELHNEEALEVIDFNISEAKLSYQPKTNEASLVCKSDYFSTQVIQVQGTVSMDHSDLDSFIVYMCVNGEEVTFNWDSNSEVIKKGGTILIPACLKTFDIQSSNATLLEVFVP
ncbi:MAG: class I mannose-6-phosphate isomerase, partial [Flavobacteriaceae bacterium]|nr:class I mannose-6-phosphate isomerase [Flavobacteriaceae bacterium]